MKKTLLATSLVSAVMLSACSEPSKSTSDMLEYIPADTAVFSGALKPVNIELIAKSLNNLSAEQREVSEQLKVQIEPDDTDANKFLSHLYNNYLDMIIEDKDLLKIYGLAKKSSNYIYFVDASPVLKLQIEDPKALQEQLDKAEQQSGIQVEEKEYQDVKYNSIIIDKAQKTSLDFLIQDDYFIVTMSQADLLEQTLPYIFELKKPEQALAQDSTFKDLAKQNKDAQQLFILNHQELVKGASGIDHPAFFYTEDQADMKDAQDVACLSELEGITQNWPRTVVATSLENQEKDVVLNSKFVIESKNKVILDSLSSIQGYIPEMVSKDAFFSMGIGLKADALPSAATNIWTDLKTPQYQCQDLQLFQNEIAKENPAQIAAVMGFVQGLEGLNFSLYGATVDPQIKKVSGFDGLIGFTAANPMNLVTLISSLIPELPNFQLENGGAAKKLSELVPEHLLNGSDPLIRLQDKNLMIFQGEKGQAVSQLFAKSEVVSNGLFQFKLDYAKLVEQIQHISKAVGEPELGPEELKIFEQSFVQSTYSKLLIEDKGIVFETHSVLK